MKLIDNTSISQLSWLTVEGRSLSLPRDPLSTLFSSPFSRDVRVGFKGSKSKVLDYRPLETVAPRWAREDCLDSDVEFDQRANIAFKRLARTCDTVSFMYLRCESQMECLECKPRC